MSKKILIIMGLTLSAGYGLLSWSIVAYSEIPGPGDSIYAEQCSGTTTGSSSAPETNYDLCCIDYNEAMDKAELDWDNHLQSLIDQEKASSDMVEEAYESLRTYNCWLEYICRAVEYSGHGTIQSGIGTGLTSVHLGQVPGCQKPQDLKMGPEWDSFMNDMKEIPIAGLLYEDAFVGNKINMLPHCMTDPNNNLSPNIARANSNFQACKQSLELRFGCPPGVPDFLCQDQSSAFVKLEAVLKKTHADQKSSALEKKLGSIVPKLQAMEAHVGYFSNFLEQLDLRFKCFADKCT